MFGKVVEMSANGAAVAPSTKDLDGLNHLVDAPLEEETTLFVEPLLAQFGCPAFAGSGYLVEVLGGMIEVNQFQMRKS
jgi:hypothetical protein